MEQVLIKGKVVLKELRTNVSKLLFVPDNPALLKRLEGSYHYDESRPLSIVFDGIEIVEQHFSDEKIQTWWEKFANCSKDANHEAYVEQHFRHNKEYNAFIFANRVLAENEIVSFLYKGKTDVGDGLSMELNPFVIQKSINSKVLYAMDVARTQLDEFSISSYKRS